MRRVYGLEGVDSTLPRKTSQSRLSGIRTVTATGRLVENTKVRETTLAKELGKITS